MSGFVAAQPADLELLNNFDRVVKQLDWSRVSRNVHVATENNFVYTLVSLRTTDVDPGDQITLGGSRHGERYLVSTLETDSLALYLRIWVHRKPQQDLAKYIPPVNLSFAVKQEWLLLRSNTEETPSTITQLSKDITILSQANCVFADLVGIQIAYLLEKSPLRTTRYDPNGTRKRLPIGSTRTTEVEEQRNSVSNLPPVTVFQPDYEPLPLASLDFCWTLDVYPNNKSIMLEGNNNNNSVSFPVSYQKHLDTNGTKALEALIEFNDQLHKSRRVNEKKIPNVLCSTRKLLPCKDEVSSDSF